MHYSASDSENQSDLLNLKQNGLILEMNLDPVQFADDIALLKQFRFEQGQLVIHTDPSVMPPKRKDWSVLSYMMDRKFTRQQFTVWLNSVEPSLVGKNAVFQTWQPVTEIDPKKV
jgi:uncharacterized protein